MSEAKQVAARMQEIGRLVDHNLPHGWGFFILAFPFGERSEKSQFVSNGRTQDIVKALQEIIDRGVIARPEEN